jgi:hypothetical protein
MIITPPKSYLTKTNSSGIYQLLGLNEQANDRQSAAARKAVAG